MGVFAQAKEVKASNGTRNYLKEGQHRLRLDSLKFGKTREKNKVSFDIFAAEFTIVSTDSSDPLGKAGNKVDWSTLSKHDIYINNVKGFFCVLMSITEAEFGELDVPLPENQKYKDPNGERVDTQGDKMFDLAAGKSQVYAGKYVDASCIKNDTGKIFPRWTIVPDDEQPEEFRGVTPQMILSVVPTGQAAVDAAAAEAAA